MAQQQAQHQGKGPFAGPFLQTNIPDAIDAAKYLQRLYGTGSTNDCFAGSQPMKNDLTNAASYGTNFNGEQGTQPGVGSANFDIGKYTVPADVAATATAYSAWQNQGKGGHHGQGANTKT